MFESLNRVSIEFTKSCNFSCVYCHQKRGKERLTLAGLRNRVEFINKLPVLSDTVDFALTGGEVTEFEEDLKEQLIYMKENIRVRNKTFSMMTNMTNVAAILELLDMGILRTDRVRFSWDGVKQSLSRKSTKYPDEFFIAQLEKISKSKYKDDVFVQLSLHPSVIPYLAESVSMLLKNGITNIGTYIIRGFDYRKEDAEIYDKEMEKVAPIFINSYLNDSNRLRYFGITKCWIDYIYRKDLPIEVTTKCQKLGKSLHITLDDKLYPCIYFGDHKLMPLGDMNTGINIDAVKMVENEYNKVPECISKNKCTLKHCLTCEGVNLNKRGSFVARDETQCAIAEVEKKWFYLIMKEIAPYITEHSLRTYWGRVNEQALNPG